MFSVTHYIELSRGTNRAIEEKGERNMFYAAFNDQYGNRHANIYTSWSRYFSDTFSPDTERLYLIEFKVKGKTYAERKANLENIVHDFQSADSDVSGGLSWGEYADVCNWFERMGKRYGLLREFRENAIC